MVLEEQGFKLFEDEISELLSKLAFEESNVDPKSKKFDSGSERTDSDLYFFDNKGRPDDDAAKDEERETVDAAFRSAAFSMKSEKNKERRKRKEKTYEDDMSKLKFVRYKSQDKSVKDNFNKSAANGMSSGSEVENPSSADEMEE